MKLRSILILRSFIFLGLLFGTFPGWMFGASTLNFPRLSFELDTFTGLAIVNPNPQDAEVTLTAYGADGQVLPGLINPAQISVPANQQIARLASELLGGELDPATIGWIQATSPTDNLTGFFLFVNSGQTLFDGANLPRSSNNIVFNQVRLEDGYDTELNILNPGTAQATVQLELISGGITLSVRTLELAPKGVARVDAGSFFGVSVTAPVAYVSVNSDTPVAGFEFVRSPNGDLLGLNAPRLSQQLTNLLFPQISVRGDFKTELGLINYTNAPVIVTVTAYQPDGFKFGPESVENNPVTLSLNGRESRLEDVDLLFGFKGNEIIDGWLEVASTAPAVNGYISYGMPSTGATAAVVSPANGSTRAIFSHIATSLGYFTGVAVLNSGQLATNLRILAIQPDGTVLGSFTTVLQPGQRISKLITDLIAEADGLSGGLIWVKSDLPVLTTSLFGSGTVLANIPPQPAPDAYLPDAGIAELKINPQISVVQPQLTQQFQVVGVGGDVTWSVNGIQGGDSTLGTIDTDGRYTAPAVIPDPRVVTITGGTPGQLAGASVDILDKQILLSSSSIIQSVAFLGGLQRLYVAELALLGAFASGNGDSPPAPPGQVGTNSELFEIAPGGVRVLLTQFPNETVTKILPYQASNGQNFLIASLQQAGKLVRFDPVNQQSTDIFFGLNQPSTMVFDAATANLLVATADEIVIVPRSFLDTGLSGAAVLPDKGSEGPQAATLIPFTGSPGVATDGCTGDVYLTDGEAGEIQRLVRRTGVLETLVTGLDRPGQILALHRKGITCPESLQLLVAERGANRILTILPSAISGLVQPWLPADDPADLTFLPGGTEFATTSGVLVAELLGSGAAQLGNSVTSIVPTPGIYGTPINSGQGEDEDLTCFGIVLEDEALGQAVRDALGLEPDALIACDEVDTLTVLTAESSGIQSLEGLEHFPKLQTLNLGDNSISDLDPLAEATELVSLDLENNDIADIFPLRNLTRLTSLNLGGNQISDLEPLRRLTALTELYLNDNNISDIGPLEDLTSLRRLFIARNDVTDLSPLDRAVTTAVASTGIPSDITFSPAGNGLTELDASDNRIRNVAALASHPDLARLMLARNQIESIAPLEGLTGLTVLDLSGNLIRDVRVLIDNPGIGEGDSIMLGNNPLFPEASCAIIEALRQKGINIDSNVSCVGLGAGPDLIMGRAEGQRETSVEVPITLRQNPDDGRVGGPDEVAATIFCIDYDQSKLFVSQSDLNEDGIPDAIRFNLPSGFIPLVIMNTGQSEREICIAVAGLGPMGTREFAYVTYQINHEAPLGNCPIRFSRVVPVSAGDRLAVSVPVDERVNGAINVIN